MAEQCEAYTEDNSDHSDNSLEKAYLCEQSDSSYLSSEQQQQQQQRASLETSSENLLQPNSTASPSSQLPPQPPVTFPHRYPLDEDFFRGLTVESIINSAALTEQEQLATLESSVILESADHLSTSLILDNPPTTDCSSILVIISTPF